MHQDAMASSYEYARQRYAEHGVDTDAALERLGTIPISLHCWQGDDVAGFETTAGQGGGGIQATGNYPGRARTIDELRTDFEKALSLIPGRHRLNLHACYLDSGGKAVERNEIAPEHFASWIDWGKGNVAGIDFNPTFFAHPKAADGFTLSSGDEGIRRFWIEHGIACRKIAASFGRAFGSPSVNNVWIPDGYKDIPVDRLGPRQRLADSLDAIFADPIAPAECLDAVESKLFGIGVESYTVGSHEFYMGYALSRRTMLCLDAGHFHPTESVAEKISALLLFLPKLLLHVSRPVRWDSDHVVVLNDELAEIAREIIRSGRLNDIHIGLDFFDASINRIAAWVIGSRNMIKALLAALLEPTDTLVAAEQAGDYTTRLALLEEWKTMPFAAIWEQYCRQASVPSGMRWLEEVKAYENETLCKRQ